MSYSGEKNGPYRHGKGTYTYPNPFFKYSGAYYNNVKHGEGKFEMGNGITIKSQFIDGEITGKAIKTWPNGSRYEGNFIDGECEGYGEHFNCNGDVYKGNWTGNKRHGKGELYTARSKSIFEGDFSNHKIHGSGTVKFENGNYFEGNFQNNSREGKGKAFLEYSRVSYDGQWKNNLPQGSHMVDDISYPAVKEEEACENKNSNCIAARRVSKPNPSSNNNIINNSTNDNIPILLLSSTANGSNSAKQHPTLTVGNLLSPYFFSIEIKRDLPMSETDKALLEDYETTKNAILKQRQEKAEELSKDGNRGGGTSKKQQGNKKKKKVTKDSTISSDELLVEEMFPLPEPPSVSKTTQSIVTEESGRKFKLFVIPEAPTKTEIDGETPPSDSTSSNGIEEKTHINVKSDSNADLEDNPSSVHINNISNACDLYITSTLYCGDEYDCNDQEQAVTISTTLDKISSSEGNTIEPELSEMKDQGKTIDTNEDNSKEEEDTNSVINTFNKDKSLIAVKYVTGTALKGKVVFPAFIIHPLQETGTYQVIVSDVTPILSDTNISEKPFLPFERMMLSQYSIDIVSQVQL